MWVEQFILETGKRVEFTPHCSLAILNFSAFISNHMFLCIVFTKLTWPCPIYFLNTQLLHHAFQMYLLFLLTLIKIRSFTHVFRRWFAWQLRSHTAHVSYCCLTQAYVIYETPPARTEQKVGLLHGQTKKLQWNFLLQIRTNCGPILHKIKYQNIHK